MSMSNSTEFHGCRQSPFFDYSLYLNWQNYSTFQTDLELEIYICQFNRFLQFRDKFQYVNGWSEIVCSIFGISSCLLTLSTLWSNKRLNATSYVYFRLISFFELFNIIFIFLHGLQQIFWYRFIRTYVWFWFMNCIGRNIGNIFAIAVDFITIFLSIERAVACLMPNNFPMINRRSIAAMVSIISYLMALCLGIPQCFANRVIMDPTSPVYVLVPSQLAKQSAYAKFEYFTESFWFFVAAAITVTSAVAIAGMVKSLTLKRTLQRVNPIRGQPSHQNRIAPKPVGKSVQGSSETSNITQSTTRQNLQLCYLQASQSLPTVFNYIFYSAHAIAYSSINPGFISVSNGIGFKQALTELNASYGAQYITCCVVLTNCLAHCFHFYLYIMFGRRFRYAFYERFKIKKTEQLFHINAGQGTRAAGRHATRTGR